MSLLKRIEQGHDTNEDSQKPMEDGDSEKSRLSSLQARRVSAPDTQPQTGTYYDLKTRVQNKFGQLRLDPHPVWDRDFKKVIFNAFEGGTRKVYIADLSNLL